MPRVAWLIAVLAWSLVACSAAAPSAPSAGGTAPAGSAAAPAAAGGAAAPQPLQRITIGVISPSLSYLPAKLADPLGYFRDEGLEAEFVQVRGPAVIPALLSGELDFTTLLSVVGANAAQGGPTRIVQFLGVRLQHVVTVRPDITTVQQLAGKRIAIESFATLPAFEARKVVEHYALPDVALVPVGAEAERLAALQSGAVDASISGIPSNLVAEHQGFPTLLRVADVVEAAQGGMGTSEARLREQPDRVARALRATARVLPVIRSQRALVVEQIGAWMDLSPTDAARAYDLVADTYSTNGVLSDAQIASYLELLRETAGLTGDASPDQLVDLSIARRVAAELGLPNQ